MRAEQPAHRGRPKNKDGQAKSPAAIAPVQTQVPPGKHGDARDHRKQENEANCRCRT